MSEGTGRPSFQILADTPVKDVDADLLEFAPYAEALALLIDQKSTSTPLILAISAPWGTGKTTLAQIVQQELKHIGEWDERHITCWFNAWQHDDAPHLGAAFAAVVAREANRHRRWWRRLLSPLPSLMIGAEQRWRRKVAVLGLSLVIGLLLVLGPGVGKLVRAMAEPSGDHWKAAKDETSGAALSLLVILAALIFVVPKVFSTTRAIGRFIEDPTSEAAKGSIASVRDQLGGLIRQATRGERRFIIFVDDLERCRPPRAVEVCEVASQILAHKGIVTVLIADMNAIAISAAIKYRQYEMPVNSAGSESGSEAAALEGYGRAYLQKLVQIQFELPYPTRSQVEAMLTPPRETATGSGLQSNSRLDGTALSARAKLVLAVLLPLVVTLSTLAAAAILWGGDEPPVFAALVGLVVAILTAVASALVDQWQRQRSRRNRMELDREIRVSSESGAVREEVVSRVTHKTGRGESETKRRYLSLQLAESGITQTVNAVVFGHLPQRPRAAKRLLNQARLLIIIAMGRGLFDDKERQHRVAEELGKWIVLRERWPGLMRSVEREPSILQGLEEAKGTSTLDELAKSRGLPEIEDKNDLLKLLQASPHVAARLSRLVLLSGSPSPVEFVEQP
jgi:hypothetical protein